MIHTLTINGNPYNRDQLERLCKDVLSQPGLESWEHSLYTFLGEWIDESKPDIEVQTSGSTGKPKIMKIRKDRMVHSAFMTLEFLGLQQDENALLNLSCDYIAGKMMVVRAFVSGMNLLPVKPSANPLAEIQDADRIDFAAFVPMQMQEMIRLHMMDKIKAVRNILIGGAPVSYGLKTQLSGLSNHIYETFGMTETISHIALKLLSKGNKADFFQAMKGIGIKQDARGCLQILAPHLSDAVITSNDVVEINHTGQFKWLGRYDNMINSGGVKLIPESLEEKISHLIPTRFFFAGLPDDKLGEKPVLVIEDGNDTTSEIESLKSQLNQLLGKYEQPKDIFFVKSFELTATGKIKRPETLLHL